MSTRATIPAPPDPDNLVPDAKNNTGDKIGGFLGAISGGGMLGSISDALERRHQKRLTEAKMYHDVMVEKLSHPAYNNPNDPEYQQTRDSYDVAKQAYLKALGDSDAKKNAEMRTAIAEHHIGSQAQDSGTGGSVSAGATPPMSPPPTASSASSQSSSSPSSPAASGSQPPSAPSASTAGGNAAIPPPPKPDMTDIIAGLPAEKQADADKRTMAQYEKKVKIDSAARIEENKAKAGGKAKHLQHVAVTNPATGQTEPGSYDPDSGEYLDQQGKIIQNAQLAAKPFVYKGPNDKPLTGWMVGDTLYDQDMKPLPSGTEKFIAWMQPRTTTTEGFKEVTQPDGSTKLVPVETSSVTTRGAPGESTTPPPPAAKIKGTGTTVGGKVPAGVSKAYDTYNGAQERFAVMQDALPRALQGDQQAMLNLLANHVGMTMGLQKGARITQSIYSEAEGSAPWLARVGARFDKDGYLTGVVLTPEQMKQMIELAKVRLDQDKAAWTREIGSAKEGYGMTPPPSTGKGKSKKSSPPPKTAGEYLDSIGIPH